MHVIVGNSKPRDAHVCPHCHSASSSTCSGEACAEPRKHLKGHRFPATGASTEMIRSASCGHCCLAMLSRCSYGFGEHFLRLVVPDRASSSLIAADSTGIREIRYPPSGPCPETLFDRATCCRQSRVRRAGKPREAFNQTSRCLSAFWISGGFLCSISAAISHSSGSTRRRKSAGQSEP